MSQDVLTDSLSAWEGAQSSYVNIVKHYGGSKTELGGGAYVRYAKSTIDKVGKDWSTWSGGYTGKVVYDPGATSVTLHMSKGVTSFGFEVEPDMFQTENMTITLNDKQTITEAVNGSGGAQFIGFYGTRAIASITITDQSGDDFAFGNFYYGSPASPDFVASHGGTSTAAVLTGKDLARTGALKSLPAAHANAIAANHAAHFVSAPKLETELLGSLHNLTQHLANNHVGYVPAHV